eukprot:GHVR01159822.1.p1 GENE.GHVR01159822.1~~GHVR01159822.1.p1  ORF type:complete len:528 (+),score=110.97 GHVR01159822.1:22-1605(+)
MSLLSSNILGMYVFPFLGDNLIVSLVCSNCFYIVRQRGSILTPISLLVNINLFKWADIDNVIISSGRPDLLLYQSVVSGSDCIKHVETHPACVSRLPTRPCGVLSDSELEQFNNLIYICRGYTAINDLNNLNKILLPLRNKPRFIDIIKCVISEACCCVSIDIISAIHDIFDISWDMITSLLEDIVCDIQIFKLLHSHNVNLRAAILTAASFGRLDTLNWALEIGAPCDDVCEAACRSGQLNTLKWGHSKNLPIDHWCMYYALQLGHLTVARWLYDNKLGLVWGGRGGGSSSLNFHEMTLAGGSSSGDITTVMWLRQQGCYWSGKEFIEAARYDRVNMLEWLSNQSDISFGPTEDCCTAAAFAGSINALRWLRGSSRSIKFEEQTAVDMQESLEQALMVGETGNSPSVPPSVLSRRDEVGRRVASLLLLAAEGCVFDGKLFTRVLNLLPNSRGGGQCVTACVHMISSVLHVKLDLLFKGLWRSLFILIYLKVCIHTHTDTTHNSCCGLNTVGRTHIHVINTYMIFSN